MHSELKNQRESKKLYIQEDESLTYGLKHEIFLYDLRTHLKRSTTLKNVLWEFDTLPFRDDLINFYSFQFDIRNDQKIYAIKTAKNYDNWFYNMLKIYLKQNCDFFNIKNLCDMVYLKSPLVCKRIVEFQNHILKEFSSDKGKYF